MKNTVRGFVLGIVLGGIAISSIALAASAEIRTLNAEFYGIRIEIDARQFAPTDVTGKEVEPFVVDGTTYLPIRAIAEAFDKEVLWDDRAKAVRIFTKSEPVTEADVLKAFEESFLKSETISLVTMGDGTQTPTNNETLHDYRVISAEKVDWIENPYIWFVTFDVKPKHNPDADFNPMRGPYMYGWAAGNGELSGDWVLGKMLFVSAVKADGVVKLEVLGTGL